MNKVEEQKNKLTKQAIKSAIESIEKHGRKLDLEPLVYRYAKLTVLNHLQKVPVRGAEEIWSLENPNTLAAGAVCLVCKTLKDVRLREESEIAKAFHIPASSVSQASKALLAP